ncbi:histidine phosphatase family protein [Candidatus Electronema sp. PJ]|uniref:histidine phosphatase family protein n=1 Tax=Candidatus Electronema sp. PJ TaxID=3401572 RepID=UPI003AA8080C
MNQEASTCLYLLRHGPAAALPGCLLGSRTDAPLSGQGLLRLNSLIEPHLQAVETWYCSPLLRARQTLAYLGEQGCQIEHAIYDQRLQEIDFGAWELRTFSEIAAADPARIEAWQRYTDFTFPEGEAVADFIQRVQAMLGILSTAGSKVGVVAHGGVIRTMICLALGLPPSMYLLFDVQPAALTILDVFSNGGVLRGLNL